MTLLLHPVILFLKWIYRLDEPNLIRDRPMQVLALGLSRCGTESLKLALEDLGYKGVYHGFESTAEQAMVWTRLWDAKFADSGRKVSVEDFDRLIGNYEAVTDALGCMFAEDLIEAYPHAKVWLSGFELILSSVFSTDLSHRKGHSQSSQRRSRVGS